MKIEQIYTGCLAQGAYYIESDGEAAIIDPLRETETYIDKAKQEGSKIKYILETHFHADFVSGHVDLARKTGATIVYGPGAKTEYEIHSALDDEILSLGKIKIKLNKKVRGNGLLSMRLISAFQSLPLIFQLQ